MGLQECIQILVLLKVKYCKKKKDEIIYDVVNKKI